MHCRTSALIAVVFVASLLPGTSSRLGAIEDHVIMVNGLSGAVTPGSLTIARPGDTVTVRVCPADLINYSYSIDKAKEEALTETFPIVGVTTAPSKATGAVSQAAIGARISKQPLKTDEDFLNTFLTLRDDLAQQRRQVNSALDTIGLAMASLSSLSGSCDAWPKLIQDATGTQSESFSTKAKDRGNDIDGLEVRLQDFLAAIDEHNLQAESSGGKSSTFLNDLSTKAATFQAAITDMRKSLSSGSKIVDRWSRIIALHPMPKLEQKFPMPQTSTRISFSVSRTPITDAARNEAPEGTEPAKVAASVIATTTVENRAYHRFNVSLGMVGTWKKDNVDFDIAPSVDSASSVTFHVRQTKKDQFGTEAAAFLGIYLHQIDPFADPRPPAWMVMLGSEISSSPKDFFVGLGLDTKQGVVFGFGITEYQSVDLAQGLKPGQEVPGMNGKPLFSLSKSNKDTIGGYLFLGFRPSIFRAFLDSRKPS